MAQRPPELSVVIPVYGEPERLLRCLHAAQIALERGSQGSSEVLVADDCSPGDLVAEVRRHFPQVRVVEGEVNLGFGGNANRGVEAARGRVVCLLNSDMYVAEDYFADCLAAFEDPSIFAVCGRILEPSGGNSGLKRLELAASTARVHFALAADGASRSPAWIPYANGGGALFRRDAFLKLGGFDPLFAPHYWEDTDLGYRAWKRGYRILYDPRRQLSHDHQATIGRGRRRNIQRIRSRNRRLFIWRNLTDLSLARILLLGTLPSALSALLRLRFRRALWALADLRHLPAAARSRARARETDVRSDSEVERLLAETDAGSFLDSPA
jgi:GT2 family glycosyltransferase